MRVIKMSISVNQTGERGYNYIKLFSTKESAVSYIEKHFPDAIDMTEKYQELRAWIDDYTAHTFEHEKPQFTHDGEYHYPINTTIEFDWEEVL